MKIGVITDIHGNIEALKAVFTELNKKNVDKIICCGDIIGIGLNSEKAVNLLLKNKEKIIAVRGNHEGYLINGIPQKIHDNQRQIKEIEIAHHKWIHQGLSESSKEFLFKLPIHQEITISGKKIYVIHYPMINDLTYKKHILKPNLEECKELFKEVEADIYLFGHTHTYCLNVDNGKWYINPGSLGCPVNKSKANCGIITIIDDKIEFEHLEVEYDKVEVVKKIKEEKYPLYEHLLKDFYGID